MTGKDCSFPSVTRSIASEPSVSCYTPEIRFISFPTEAILRSGLRHFFRWLKDKGVTAVITAERGRKNLSRHGFEEYDID